MRRAAQEHRKKRLKQRNRARDNRAARGYWSHPPVVRKHIRLALECKTDWIKLHDEEVPIPSGWPMDPLDDQEIADFKASQLGRGFNLTVDQTRRLIALTDTIAIEDWYSGNRDELISMLKTAWFLFDQINGDVRRRVSNKGQRWKKMPAPTIENGEIIGTRFVTRQNGEPFPAEALDFLKYHAGQGRGRAAGVKDAKDGPDLVTGHSLKAIFTLVQAFARKHGFPRIDEKLYFKDHWTQEFQEETYDDPKMVGYLGIIDDDFTKPTKLATIAKDIGEDGYKAKFDDIHRSATTPQMRETLAESKKALRDRIEARLSKTDLVKVGENKERVLGKDFKDLAPHHQILALLGNALDDRFEPAWWEGFDIKSRMNE